MTSLDFTVKYLKVQAEEKLFENYSWFGVELKAEWEPIDDK